MYFFTSHDKPALWKAIILGGLYGGVPLQLQIVPKRGYFPSITYINGLVQYCSNSIANAMELLQSCAKPPIQCIAFSLPSVAGDVDGVAPAMPPAPLASTFGLSAGGGLVSTGGWVGCGLVSSTDSSTRWFSLPCGGTGVGGELTTAGRLFMSCTWLSRVLTRCCRPEVLTLAAWKHTQAWTVQSPSCPWPVKNWDGTSQICSQASEIKID